MRVSRLLFAFLLVAASARAQGIAVAPVSIELGPEQRTATITVANRGTAPVTVQVRPFVWTQRDNQDELAPTDRLAVSPPFTEIAPGQAQIVRLVLRQGPAGQEDTYRLLIDEIPPPMSRSAIRVALRFSVPVFATAQVGEPELTYAIGVGPTGAQLAVRNRGSRHARFIDADLLASGAPPISLASARGAYILPGAERRFPVQDGGRLRSLRSVALRAQSSFGPLNVLVPVGAGP